MNALFASLRSIVLGAAVLVAGVMVRRSSLLGFDVAGRVGLDAVEAMQAIEEALVDASWPVPVSIRAAASSPATKAAPVKAPRVKREPTFYGIVVDAVAPHRNLGTLTLRNASTSPRAPARVVIDCYAGKGTTAEQHKAIAAILAQALCNDGYQAAVNGSEVHVFARGA